ncbi:Pkinase_Tyr domain-containing protein/LRRNT_2 domain-containing protein/LRR_4 domain-containing protein/LRR_6 domain-containing protein/LRR_8 domain-containing protein [Cephalotus follicularis]|uniref:Pkinase_Tyr domain-containing protein/LRRNT_2 domain-containing protein/LRR_4 domain-containing protein/LRR_6 domain-containing protein/LRR_8 domain-containing protein n=1 Tax=Cephalotus follicularis TaxID=3775 RepID=A0A1Q3B828_CEPFO|nr:Pkinase_Tyr domain-containing protein/LRRNT_2 domain-containing protein/LRR_4 domain-containing protein/LRR_6 domain-containing protein/LRR_8 domain-containing protein [Cephalotus follicularis]
MALTRKVPLLLSLSFTFILSSASTESDILLSFKSSVEDTKNTLSSWSNTSSIHYCNWTGITCSTTSSLTVTSLNLQSMNLSGEISSSICELSSLTYLNLADNLFNQPMPLHLSQCSSLETLNLSNNLIWGTIPDQISQFGSLKVLDLSRNHVEGRIPESIGALVNLQVLNFGSNLLSGTVPSVFQNVSELLVLDLSQNPYLLSVIPSDIGKLDKLEQLLFQSSGFHGEIPDSFTGLQSLVTLDLSQNNLTGWIPQTLGSSLKNLVSFDVSQNRLLGSFPNGICNSKGLASLTLHTNLFNYSIPNSINECLNLERFQIQNNGFSGDFPIGLWSLPKIKLIRAENNRFSGEIPDSISIAAQLEQVQIDNNSFTSKIPQGLGLVKSLYRFSASLNGFYGELPPNFCDSPVMSIINLSHNSLSGQIPEMKKCRKLVSLSLADNSLNGEIPPSLADLPVLTYLDLSNNNLTGSIPQGLQNLKLALFNVSYNRLSGEVPLSLISGLPASYLQGNPGLCGPGLPDSCTDHKPRNHNAGLTTLACALISISFAFGTVILAAGFFMFRRYNMRKCEMGIWHSLFFYPLRVTEHDLIMSMDEKSAVGSGGAFGRVFIISLPSGELVAVKKLVNFGIQSSKALKAEVKILAKVRNKNMIKILGFCHSDESIFLIYEFLEKGSLDDLISRSDINLHWGVRMRIAIGVAQGLAYLHKDYAPQLFHRNLKSRNVLLDADYEPKLTDFALDRILGEAAFQSTIASESAYSCYNAPEYGYTKKATEQVDVYSFGVVLLELVTGRQAEKAESADQSLDIVKWVRRKINITNGALQVLDPRISNSCQQEMLGALDVALRCTSVMPEKRPPMVEVVKALQSLGSRTCLPNLELSSSLQHSDPM